MARFSKVYKVGNKSFRYNYGDATLEYISKMSKEELAQMKADNEEWMEKFGHPLWEADEMKSVSVVDRIGCFREDWEESPEGCCERFAMDIDEELHWMMKGLESEMKYWKEDK